MRSLLILSLVFYYCNAYKIFMYNPKFGASHVNFMGKLADILVRAGHEVIAYSPITDETVTTNGTKLAKVIIRERDFDSIKTNDMQTEIWSGKLDGFYAMQNMFVGIRTTFGNLCEKQLEDVKLMDSFRKEKFDIGIGEPFDMCYYGVLHVIGVKNYITVSSSGVFDQHAFTLGIPPTPSFVPTLINQVILPMTYLERFANLVQTIIMNTKMTQWFAGTAIEVMKNKFGQDFDPNEHLANSAFYFANVDEHVDFPRPISHKIVYIGGTSKAEKKPLEKKYEEILQKSKKGVVLVSFGTVALSIHMPQEVKQVFLDTFKKFPDVTFVWKYERDEDRIAEGYENVITEKWVPQNELLGHPKLLAFVSHGGMNSIQEGASKGTPMIMVPLFADQYRNSKTLEFRKMAVVLDRKHFTVEKLSEALKTVIENDSYKKNAMRMSALIAAKPMSAEERIVKYTEFAAKYGPNLNLDMHGRYLNFIQFYCLDIIIPAILLVAGILYILYRLVRSVLRKFLSVVCSENKLKGD